MSRISIDIEEGRIRPSQLKFQKCDRSKWVYQEKKCRCLVRFLQYFTGGVTYMYKFLLQKVIPEKAILSHVPELKKWKKTLKNIGKMLKNIHKKKRNDFDQTNLYDDASCNIYS